MRIRSSILGMACTFACVMPVVLAAGAAQAAATASTTTAGQTRVAPPAPSGARALAVVAVAPTISPSVNTGHVAPGRTYSCADGNLCTLAWDPTTDNWKIFRLYYCNRYSLSNWNGDGTYWNRQTGDVTSYFYRQDGTVKTTITTADREQRNYDWDPIWSIRNCG